jgi:threonine dehydratase
VKKYFVKRLEARGWSRVRQSQQDEEVGLVWDAMARIYGLGVVETKLMGCPWLVEAVDRFEEQEQRHRATRVWLKMENSQVTGSFKARGAAYKVKKLFEKDALKNGIVISSTGNHALAVMHACCALAQSGDHGNICPGNHQFEEIGKD